MEDRGLPSAGDAWPEYLNLSQASLRARVAVMTDSTTPAGLDRRTTALFAVVLIAATAFVLWSMGRLPICKCGYVEFWHGDVFSSGNSQHIADWYTASHVIHGFIFYALLWLAVPRWSVGARLLLAIVIEGGWEIFENTEFTINRYRETTIALDYYGDSVLNSVADILAMVAGFLIAATAPVWTVVLAAILLELGVGYTIRDNLTLNVIMLIWPLEAIKQWQTGGA
jgi:hypothetical protein